MDKFEVGDVVQLKSGGPYMTVSFIPSFPDHQIRTIQCVWFDDIGKLQEEQFKAVVVKKVEHK